MRSGSWRGTPDGRASRPYGMPCSSSDLVMGLASPGAFPCPERSPAYNVQFSKRAGDGHFVAFGTELGQLVILDTRANAVVLRDHNGPVGWGQTDRATSGISNTNSTRRQRLETPGRGNMGYCQSWGVRQPAVVAQYRALINCIFDLEWTHDDRRIALACGDAKIRVHDIETNIEVLMLHGHAGSVKAVSANPIENSVLLSGSRDGSFALWDTRLQREKPDMEGLHRLSATEEATMATAPVNRVEKRYLAPVEHVHFANHLSTGQRKRPLSYVKGEESKVERARGAGLSSVTAVEWMPDGQKFLTAGQDGLVKLWDTRYINQPVQAAGQPHGTPSGSNTSMPLSPASSNARSPNAAFSSPSTPRSPPSSHDRLGPNRTSGRGGAHRAKGARGRRRVVPPFGRVTGGESIAEETSGLGGRPCGVSSVHACDDGSRIAVCTVKNHVSVYAYNSGSLRALGAFTGNQNSSSYYIKAKLSPDGSMLASGATNDALCLWNVDCPGPPVARLRGHLNEVTGVDWCRSEPLKLATSSDDETVRVWTVDPLRVAKRRSSTARPASSLSLSSSSSSSSSALSSSFVNERPGVGAGSGVAGTSSGWTRASLRPLAGAALRGGGGNGNGGRGGSSAGSGDVGSGGGGGGGDSGGKFRVGMAVAGESSWWKRGGTKRDAGAADTRDHLRDDGGRLSPSDARPRQRSGGVEGSLQDRDEHQNRNRSDDMMDVSPSPPPTTPLPTQLTTPATPLVADTNRTQTRGEAAGFGGESLVFSPRSPNKKLGAKRYSKYAATTTRANDAIARDDGDRRSTQADQHGRCDPVAQRETQPREDENAGPGLQLREVDASSQQWPVRSAEGQALGGGLDVIAVDAPLAPSSNRGILDGLPRGWSTAARAGQGILPGVRGQHQHQNHQQQEQQQTQQQQQQQQQQRKTSKTIQMKKMRPRQKGTQEGDKGGVNSPGPESRHTLFAFWSRGGGGGLSDSDAHVGTSTETAEERSQFAT